MIGTALMKEEKPYPKMQRYPASTAKTIMQKEEGHAIPVSLVQTLAQRKLDTQQTTIMSLFFLQCFETKQRERTYQAILLTKKQVLHKAVGSNSKKRGSLNDALWSRRKENEVAIEYKGWQ